MPLGITEETRMKLALSSSVVSMICILPSLMVFSAGIYIQVAVQTKIRLIEGFDVAALPGYIVSVGIFSLLYNSSNAAIVFLSRRRKKREKMIPRLFHLVIVGLVLFLTVFVAGLVCFIQINHLDESFKKGILSAMKLYKSDVKMKEEIDMLQIDYKCCGSGTYKDWFNVEWIHEEFRTKSLYLRSTDHVPFSCCNFKSKRPCIHYNVHNDNHYNYSYRKGTTLYSAGCRETLVDFYGHTLLTDVGALIIAISFLQFLSVVLTRLVQTSMLTAVQIKDPFGTAVGYIFYYTQEDMEKGQRDPLLDDLVEGLEDNEYDSSYDELSENEESVIANEPLYTSFRDASGPGSHDRSIRPKTSVHTRPSLYEVPYATGHTSPASALNSPPLKPSLPKFAPPPPPGNYIPSTPIPAPDNPPPSITTLTPQRLFPTS